MTTHPWILLGLFLAVLLMAIRPLGTHIPGVMEGRSPWALRLGSDADNFIQRLCGVRR